MHAFTHMLRAGGIGLWLTILLGLAGLASTVALVALSLVRKEWTIPLGSAGCLGMFALITAVLGFSFYSRTMQNADRIMYSMPPEYQSDPRFQQELAAEASMEGAIPLVGGLLCAAIPGISAVALFLMATRRRSQPVAIPD